MADRLGGIAYCWMSTVNVNGPEVEGQPSPMMNGYVPVLLTVNESLAGLESELSNWTWLPWLAWSSTSSSVVEGENTRNW